MYDDAGLAALLGESMGVVFAAPDEKTVISARRHCLDAARLEDAPLGQPDVLIMNTGYAKILGFNESIIMGTAGRGEGRRIFARGRNRSRPYGRHQPLHGSPERT